MYVTINTIPFSGALLLLLLLCSHLFRISHSADDDVPCVVSIVLLRSQITPPAFAAEQEIWCSLSLFHSLLTSSFSSCVVPLLQRARWCLPRVSLPLQPTNQPANSQPVIQPLELSCVHNYLLFHSCPLDIDPMIDFLDE